MPVYACRTALGAPTRFSFSFTLQIQERAKGFFDRRKNQHQNGVALWPIAIRDVRICACPPLLGSLRPKPYPEESTTAPFFAYHGCRYQNMVSKA